MAKVIKGTSPTGADELATTPVDTSMGGLGELGDAPRKGAAIISSRTFEAQNDSRKIISEAEAKAAQIIADAEAQAQQVLADAQAEAEQMRAAAHDNGFKEGADQAAAQYTQVIAEHSARMEQKETQVAMQVQQIALAIARKLIGVELQTNVQAIVDMAKKHLQSIRQRREVYMRVSPADLENLREHKRELIDQLGRAKEIEIRVDEALTPGSMIIETEAGTIDARLETQMAVIEKVLLGRKMI